MSNQSYIQKNMIDRINAWAVGVIRYSAGIIDWTIQDIKRMDIRTWKNNDNKWCTTSKIEHWEVVLKNVWRWKRITQHGRLCTSRNKKFLWILKHKRTTNAKGKEEQKHCQKRWQKKNARWKYTATKLRDPQRRVSMTNLRKVMKE